MTCSINKRKLVSVIYAATVMLVEQTPRALIPFSNILNRPSDDVVKVLLSLVEIR